MLEEITENVTVAVMQTNDSVTSPFNDIKFASVPDREACEELAIILQDAADIGLIYVYQVVFRNGWDLLQKFNNMNSAWSYFYNIVNMAILFKIFLKDYSQNTNEMNSL